LHIYDGHIGCFAHCLNLAFQRILIKKWNATYKLLVKGSKFKKVFRKTEFSQASDLIAKKRNRLLPDSINEVICLKTWLDLDHIIYEL
jgi:hypothetical protein